MSISLDMHRLKSVKAGRTGSNTAWVTFTCEEQGEFSIFVDYEIALALEEAYTKAIESQKGDAS